VGRESEKNFNLDTAGCEKPEGLLCVMRGLL